MGTNARQARKEHEAHALKVFISYSHKDEAFKDELVTMLAGLQRRGIVDAWQDRRIEAGDEWNKSIQTAMNECDIALLLVSPDYLASRFIQEQEQPKLLQRREEIKTRVMPIIVRPCMWQSEPACEYSGLTQRRQGRDHLLQRNRRTRPSLDRDCSGDRKTRKRKIKLIHHSPSPSSTCVPKME